MRRGTRPSKSTETIVQAGFPSQECRVPVQPRKQERVFSFASSCLFPGKQTRCQKLYPVGEGKRSEETEGGGGRRKKIISLEKEKDGVKMITIGNNFRKVTHFLKHLKPPKAHKRHKPAWRYFPALRFLIQT